MLVAVAVASLQGGLLLYSTILMMDVYSMIYSYILERARQRDEVVATQ